MGVRWIYGGRNRCPLSLVRNPGIPVFRRGFTILELLAVIAVISILGALMIPAISSIGGSRNLENAGRIVADQWNLARQEAITQNRVIEFRLYQFQDSQQPGSESAIQALQIFERDAVTGTHPISRPTFLPPGIVISDQAALTSLVSLPPELASADDPLISRAPAGYLIRKIQIQPNGTPLLPSGEKHFLTIVSSKVKSMPPNHYVLLSISPANGRLQTFRP